MNLVKLLLYKIFGLKNYLKIVSSVYISLINHGKLKASYPELHNLKNIIKPGDTCVDIGANIGYYSVFMSKLAGANGKIYAVEPVGTFREVWQRNMDKNALKNYEMLPFALGAEEKSIKMGMPKVKGEIHHGMTKVLSDEKQECEQTFDVEMRVPDNLFRDVEKIDFLKIDVEGYESVVFDNLRETLSKHSPLIQGEMGGHENKLKCIEILSGFGYKIFKLSDGSLVEISANEALNHPEDLYFRK